MSTTEWLRELGAVRPMAVASNIELVIGKWHDGYYPIQYSKNGRSKEEHWYLFGIECEHPLKREDVERIVKHLKQECVAIKKDSSAKINRVEAEKMRRRQFEKD